MTTEQKEQITLLRHQGYGYTKIADILSISENTVKSYCRRNGLSSDMLNTSTCKHCGEPIVIKEKCKSRQFCSDKCRALCWNSRHNRTKTTYHFICEKCGTSFESYGNKNRKYCSHNCYVKHRFCKECGGDE